MASIMNNNSKIKETPNVSETYSLENRKIKTGLKTSPLINNKTITNNYEIKETPNISEASSFEKKY